MTNPLWLRAAVVDPAREVVMALFGPFALGSLDRLRASVTRAEAALAPDGPCRSQ